MYVVVTQLKVEESATKDKEKTIKDVDESAIVDESDWEDSEESESASIGAKTSFRRVDSLPELTTRRSITTTMLHQNDRAASVSRSTLALRRSRTISPNSPSLAASPDSDDGSLLVMKPTNFMPQNSQSHKHIGPANTSRIHCVNRARETRPGEDFTQPV